MTSEPATSATETTTDEGLPLIIKLLLLVAALVVTYIAFVDVLGFITLI
jgi:hypothetical protein